MIRYFAILALAAASFAQTADRKTPPGPLVDDFYGAWRMEGSAQADANPQLSFIERGDSIETNSNGRTYSFKLDGAEYPAGESGQTVSWRRTGDRSYEATQKDKGEIVTVSAVQISADGKTMRTTVKPKDGSAPLPIVMERSQGATAAEPLIGFWKLALVSGSKVIEPSANGVRITSSAGDTYTAVFDGRDYPMTGTAVDPGAVVSLNRISDRAFEETRKSSGIVIARVRFELSPDGKTLTQSFTDLRAGSDNTGVTKWKKQ